MPRLSLIPENVQFYDMLEGAAENMVATSRVALELFRDHRDVPQKLKRLEELEHQGDEITHEIMRALNRTFITPLDREDITDLIRALDDVVDSVWGAGLRLDLYRLDETTAIAARLSQVVVQETEQIASALPKLRHRGRMKDILPLSVEIHRLENQADALLHQGLAELFEKPDSLEDLVRSIKWREIYEFLEVATDMGEDAANVLESIVLKYA